MLVMIFLPVFSVLFCGMVSYATFVRGGLQLSKHTAISGAYATIIGCASLVVFLGSLPFILGPIASVFW